MHELGVLHRELPATGKAQREGLIPDTRKKKIDDKRTGGRPGMGGGGFGGDRSGPPRF